MHCRSKSPAGGQAGPTPVPRPGAPSPTPSDRVEADKAPTSRLAESDPELLDRTDAEPVPVLIKLDYDSRRHLPGRRRRPRGHQPVGDRRAAHRATRPPSSDYEAYVAEPRGRRSSPTIRRQVPEAPDRPQLPRRLRRRLGRRCPPTGSGTVLARRRRRRRPGRRAAPAAHRLEHRLHRRAHRSATSSAPRRRRRRRPLRQPRHRHLARAPVLRRPRQPAPRRAGGRLASATSATTR